MTTSSTVKLFVVLPTDDPRADLVPESHGGSGGLVTVDDVDVGPTESGGQRRKEHLTSASEGLDLDDFHMMVADVAHRSQGTPALDHWVPYRPPRGHCGDLTQTPEHCSIYTKRCSKYNTLSPQSRPFVAARCGSP